MRYKLGLKTANAGPIKLRMMDYIIPAKILAQLPKGDFGHRSLVTKPWGMLGNDKYGNCAWAGAAHETMLLNAEAGKTVEFTTEDVLSDYASTGFVPATGANDNGTDLLQMAEYRRTTGIIDAAGIRHRIAAYLAFDPTNPDQLAIATFFFTACGVASIVMDDADDLFDEGKPWTSDGTPSNEGHYTPCIQRKSGLWQLVTWGGDQMATPDYMEKEAYQGIAFVSIEMMVNGKDLDGFGLNELQQDLNALHV